LKTLDTLNKYITPSLFLTLRGMCFFVCLVITSGLQAEQNLIPKKAPIQLEYTPPSANTQNLKGAPSAVTITSAGKPNEIKDRLIKISRIRLQGDTLYPEYGITNEFLHTRINQVYSHMNEKLSISDMNKIADALTLAYREKGLTFNQAFVTPQEIVGSTLTIHVLKGTLAEIDIYNNELFSTEQLIAPFAELIGKVIYEPNIKKVVESLNEQPGLKIFSFFSVGLNQGEARLNIKVMEETQHTSQLIVDNKGVSQTGINRLLISHTINNPLHQFGQLRTTILTTNEPNNLFGSLSYNFPVNPTNQIELSMLRSDFAVTGQFSNLGLEGDLTSLEASWVNRPDQFRPTNLLHQRRLSLSTKKSAVTSEAFPEFLNESVDYTALSGSYQLHALRPWQSNSQHIITIRPTFSHISSTDNKVLPSHFWLVNASYDFMTPRWADIFPLQHPFRLSAKGQYTPKQLPSSEQFTTTGSTANRGFEPGIFSGDIAYSLSLEQAVDWSIDLSNHSKSIFLQPFIFFDYSYGKLNQNIDLAARFKSAGFGLEINYEGFAKTNITIGHPIDDNVSSQLNDDRKHSVIYALFSLSF